MSCKTFNLKSCEIQGATYQGRKIDFVNKVITQDVFTAKVYDTQGYLLTEIIGIKSGSVVYFPFTEIQNLSKDKYRIKYWADFYLLGTILLGEEELTIGNTCPNCEVDDSTIPFILELGTETINFSLQLIYIAIGEGSDGEVDLTAYLKKEDAILQYAQRNHTHSYNDLSDLPTITAGIQSIQEGSNITIDNTDPDNPIISSQAGFYGIATSDSTTVSFTGDGTISNPLSADSNSISVTKTSELTNDGADGVNPFITAQDIPASVEQVNADWNATSGKAEILNKPTIPTPIDVSTKAETNASNISGSNIISWRVALDLYSKSEVNNLLANKLDKPTVDGTWVVTKSGASVTYTDASTLGKNISNTNLVWSADRSQNLGGYKLSFTNGRFSVPTLEMEVTTANSVPNKIWNDGANLKFTNGAGINNTVGANIGNSNVTTVGTYTYTQAHAWVHNTAGFSYKLLNIPSAVTIKDVLIRTSTDDVQSATAVEILADDGATSKYANEAALDAAFPSAISGFELLCPNITTTNFPDGLIYKKTAVGWRVEKLFKLSDV